MNTKNLDVKLIFYHFLVILKQIQGVQIEFIPLCIHFDIEMYT